jgi:hypothetical protein
MEARSNPYSPGAGRIPSALVGRDRQIDEWETALLRIEDSLDARPMVLHGLRGVGKTVLLLKMHESALGRGWISAFVEAMPGKKLREQLSGALESKLVDIARPNVGERVLSALKTALSFSATISMNPSLTFGLDLSKARGSNAGPGDLSGDVERLLRDLSGAAEELDVGVALFIDEAQDLDRGDMAALLAAVQTVAMRQLRIAVVLAGLPTLPAIMAEARSYSERQFSYHRISNLDAQEAAAALREPARLGGVDWTDKAVREVVALTGGYPFFLQEYGSACWLAARASPIDVRTVTAAKVLAAEQLDNGFYLSRWERATDAEKRYLRAMAEDNDKVSQSADIAKRLRSRQSSLSSIRLRLIRKGIIFAPEKGQVSFTIPQMSDFIKRQGA